MSIQAFAPRVLDPEPLSLFPVRLFVRQNSRGELCCGRGGCSRETSLTFFQTIRRETAKHEQAGHDYAVTGSKILELATKLAGRQGFVPRAASEASRVEA